MRQRQRVMMKRVSQRSDQHIRIMMYDCLEADHNVLCTVYDISRFRISKRHNKTAKWRPAIINSSVDFVSEKPFDPVTLEGSSGTVIKVIDGIPDEQYYKASTYAVDS